MEHLELWRLKEGEAEGGGGGGGGWRRGREEDERRRQKKNKEEEGKKIAAKLIRDWIAKSQGEGRHREVSPIHC